MDSQSEPVLRPAVHPLECSPLADHSRATPDVMSPCDAARKERRRPPSLFGGTPSCSPKPRPSAVSSGTSPNNPIVGFAPIVGQLPSSTTACSANASFALPQGQSTASVPSSCRTQPCSIHGLTGIRVDGNTLKIGSFVVSDKGCSSAKNLLLVMNPCLPKPEPVATPPLRSSKQEEPVSPLFYTNDEFPSQSQPSTAHVSVETSPQMVPNTLNASTTGGFKSVPLPLAIGTPITRRTPTHHHICPSPQQRGVMPSPVPPMTPMLSALHAPLKYSDLDVETRVDSGASGTVFKALHKEHSKYFAVKRINLSELVDNPSLASGKNPRLRQLQSIVHRELQILHSEYRSAYIIKTYNAFFDADNSCLNIVMEFMDYGSLDHLGHLLYEAQHPDASISESDRSPLPERMLAVVAEQVLTGLRDMHEKGHVHRDIKPSNVLINRAGITKLSDFGLTECVNVVGSQGRRGSNGGGDHASNHSFHSNVSASAISDVDRCTCHDGMDEDDAAIAMCSGTDRYMSPERQRGESHGPPSDIWSFGMTLAECAVGYYPIDTSKCQDEFERMDAMKKVVFTDADSTRLSSEFKDFITQAMAFDETKRPSAVELLEHPWFAMWEGTFSLAQKLRDTLSPHVTFSPVGARAPHLGMLLPPASTPGGRPPPTASPTAVSVATMPIIDRLQGQSPYKGRLPPFGQTPPSDDSPTGPPVWREHTRDI